MAILTLACRFRAHGVFYASGSSYGACTLVHDLFCWLEGAAVLTFSLQVSCAWCFIHLYIYMPLIFFVWCVYLGTCTLVHDWFCWLEGAAILTFSLPFMWPALYNVLSERNLFYSYVPSLLNSCFVHWGFWTFLLVILHGFTLFFR